MKLLIFYSLAVLLVLMSILMFFWDVPINFSRELFLDLGVISYIAYVLILITAVVFMPLSVMPIVPIVASVLGPLPTALLSIVGWTLGASIAFLISRYIGRPILEKFIDMKKLDSFVEQMPKDTHFWFIVLLRLTLPVDFVSYALGLTKSLGFASYFVATTIGVAWFSFAFAYLGDAFFKGNVRLLIELSLISVIIFIVGWYLLRRKKDDK